MGATEWFLLIVVVILIPLAIAVAVTLWSLEQARQRNKKNRPNAKVRRIAIPQPTVMNGTEPSDGAPSSTTANLIEGDEPSGERGAEADPPGLAGGTMGDGR